MFSPVDRFRVDLTSVVRRLSRAQSNETAIDEMVSHFDGLFQEECLAEQNEKLAEKNARKRMGSIYKIAFQIVNSPDRAKKGLRLQACMFVLYVLIIPVFICLMMGLYSRLLNGPINPLYAIAVLLFVSGFVAGLGISIAKRIAWKPLAIFVVTGLVLTSMMVNNTFHPENRMTKEQFADLVGAQSALDPKVAKIEAQVKTILNVRDQSPEAWKKELSNLPALVKEGNVPFYQVDSKSSGSYLYPVNIANDWRDETVNYRVTLGRTEDLSTAQKAWMKNAGRDAFLLSDIGNRERSYQFWRDAAAHQSTLWTRGFLFAGGVFFRLGAIFSLFALLGFLLGSVRVYGLDWLRGSRA